MFNLTDTGKDLNIPTRTNWIYLKVLPPEIEIISITEDLSLLGDSILMLKEKLDNN
jgi:hypothetical protein